MTDRKSRRALIQAADRTCSALLLNCCQMSCCLPQNSIFVHVTAPPQAADWMGQLAESDPSVKVRDLVVPGTHDSASYTIAAWKPFSAVGRTQNLVVGDQLLSGARYLDVRFAGATSDPNKLSIWHGCLQGSPLIDILEEVSDFLHNHKGEFVILEMVPEYGRALTAEQKDIMLELVKDVFGDLIFPGKDLNDLQERLTLAEVVTERKKQVAVLIHSRFFENYSNKTEDDIADQYGYVQSQRCMRNKWHNTREKDQLLEWNLDECEKCNRNVWLNNQFILTPGVSGTSDIIGALIGQNSLQPMAMASSRLYEPDVLDSFLRRHAEKRWNLLMLDCIDRCPIVVQFAIALNFPTEIVLKRAAATCTGGDAAIDVTEKLKTYVCRNRVLLLTHFSSDLDLPAEDGVLTIAYRMGGADEVLTVDFNADTQLIVSKFVTTEYEGNKVVVGGDDNQPAEGFVARGQVYSDPPASHEKKGPVLKFNRAEDAVEFDIVK